MKLIGALAVFAAAAGLSAGSPPAAYPSPAVAAVVPVYTAVHSPASGSDDEVKELLRAILAELKEIKTIASQPLGPPPADSSDAIGIARQACVGCHSPAKSAEKGGEFTLFVDESGSAFAPLNPRDRRRIVARVNAGSMPPPAAGKLLPAGRKVVADHFSK